MPDEISINIDTKELYKALERLPRQMATRIRLDALQAGGDVVLEKMVVLAPERTDTPTPNGDSLPPGILKADLHTQVVNSKSGAKVKVGPTKIAGHVARWIENGWTFTGHKPGKKQIKQIPGKHFMAGAFDESVEQAVNTIVESIREGLKDANSPD